MTPPQSEYRTILLSRGQVTKVDPDDYEWLVHFSWHAHYIAHAGTYYASTNLLYHGKRRSALMQRILLKMDGDERFVDHINGDPLDNRRENLRVATRTENARNRKPNRNGASRFKGVSFHSRSGMWRSQLRLLGKCISLGLYKTEYEAHLAYCYTAAHYHGEFARMR